MKKCLILICLCGCANVNKSQLDKSFYDFGFAPSDKPITSTIAWGGVKAASDIDTRNIRYRLAYKSPIRVYSYTESQWVVSPLVMINRRLQERISFANPRKNTCKLYLELNVFDQIFDSPISSRGRMQFQAFVLMNSEPVMQQQILIDEPADSADAKGGVAALIKSTEKAILQVQALLAGTPCGK